HARIERAVRILEDDLDAAPERQQLLVLEPGKIDAVIEDLAGGRPLEQQDAAAGCRLAATTLADQPQRLAAAKGEVDAVDRSHLADQAAREDALGDRKELAQAPHLEERPSVGCRRRHAVAPVAAPISWPRRHADRWPAGPTGSSGGPALGQAPIPEQEGGGEAEAWAGAGGAGGRPAHAAGRARRGGGGRWSRGTERSNAIV